jgi:hypothetical protein
MWAAGIEQSLDWWSRLRSGPGDNTGMTVVPLFLSDPPGGHDASHRIMSPGGYEFWQVSATDRAQLRFTVGFFEGHPSNALYRQAYRSYRRRPTTHAPPLPRDFSIVEIELTWGASASFGDFVRLPPGGLLASDQRLEIVAAPHSLRRNPDRSLHLRISTARCLADLIFRPLPTTAPPTMLLENGEYIFRSDPKCEATGKIEIGTPGSRKIRAIEFLGIGSHEHRWRPHRDE